MYAPASRDYHAGSMRAGTAHRSVSQPWRFGCSGRARCSLSGARVWGGSLDLHFDFRGESRCSGAMEASITAISSKPPSTRDAAEGSRRLHARRRHLRCQVQAFREGTEPCVVVAPRSQRPALAQGDLTRDTSAWGGSAPGTPRCSKDRRTATSPSSLRSARHLCRAFRDELYGDVQINKTPLGDAASPCARRCRSRRGKEDFSCWRGPGGANLPEMAPNRASRSSRRKTAQRRSASPRACTPSSRHRHHGAHHSATGTACYRSFQKIWLTHATNARNARVADPREFAYATLAYPRAVLGWATRDEHGFAVV